MPRLSKRKMQLLAARKRRKLEEKAMETSEEVEIGNFEEGNDSIDQLALSVFIGF